MSDFKKLPCVAGCPTPSGFVDCNGDSINMGDSIARCEDIPDPTTVTVTNTVAGHRIATVNVNGTPTDIDETLTAITEVVFDEDTRTLTITYRDEAGDLVTHEENIPAIDAVIHIGPAVIDPGTLYPGYYNQIVTDGNSNVWAFSIDGTPTLLNITETITTIYNVLTYANKHEIFKYKNESGLVKSVYETITSITGVLTSGVKIGTFNAEDGTTTDIYVPAQAADVTTTITNTVGGHSIGLYTNEAGAQVNINETVTTFHGLQYNKATGVLTAEYTDEGGTRGTYTASIVAQATAYFNGTNPNTATIFSLDTPPTVNNNELKENPDYVLVGTDGTTWFWNGTTYVTAPAVAASTEWYLNGSTVDAGPNKVAPIYRLKGIAVGTSLNASTSPQFATTQYGAYDDFGVNKQQFLFRDSRFPATQPAGFSLSNGGGGGDYYPVFGANPRGGTTSFLIGCGLAPADDAAGNKNPAMNFRVNRTGLGASPTLNRSLFAWQNYTSTKMVMDVDGRVCIGDNFPFTASAQLELNSTTKGFLLPRMTTAQINAIASPANGLMVYNTTLNKVCVYELNAWRQVTTTAM